MNMFTSTGETQKVNHKFNCDTKVCYVCEHGTILRSSMLEKKTIDSFGYRWNSYKVNDYKITGNETCSQEHLFKQFNCKDRKGLLKNVSITVIDKTGDRDRNKREDYWKRLWKMYALFGLNVGGLNSFGGDLIVLCVRIIQWPDKQDI